MKLTEALAVVRAAERSAAKPLRLCLACGFNSTHLQTLIAAYSSQIAPDYRVAFTTGLYGDLWGNLERMLRQEREATIVLLEWSDLDPRLGFRSLGDWSPASLDDIATCVENRCAQFARAVALAAQGAPVIAVLPTLPLPPIFYTPGWLGSTLELRLRSMVASLAAELSMLSSVKVVNPQRVDWLSRLEDRLDLATELVSGFPYRLAHASALGKAIVQVIHGPIAKKGLIVDLDNTLWRGILGDVDVDGVSWTLEEGSQVHGLFQQLVKSLCQAGVLVAVASKNDQTLVDAVFERDDVIVDKAHIFPFEVNWGPKSESVTRILKTWNVGADSVVFVDDSPLELAEVKAAHPGIECVTFPQRDVRAVYGMLQQLRDLFGKTFLTDEDTLRARSVRETSHLYATDSSSATSDTFLRQADAVLRIDFGLGPNDHRALELVNKTNQFNLNGKRHTETSWRTLLAQRGAIGMTVSYEDKYGPLGKIAVLAGQLRGNTVHLSVWVMSCRAFSRRVEYRSLMELFKRSGAAMVEFDYAATGRNGPFTQFLAGLSGRPVAAGMCLSLAQFEDRSPSTFHNVTVSPGPVPPSLMPDVVATREPNIDT